MEVKKKFSVCDLHLKKRGGGGHGGAMVGTVTSQPSPNVS